MIESGEVNFIGDNWMETEEGRDRERERWEFK